MRGAASGGGERLFEDGKFYNTKEAYTRMGMGRTTFWRKVSAGAVKWRLRRNFPGKWFMGRDLNSFYYASY